MSENFQFRFVSRQSASALAVVSSRAATSALKIGRRWVGARLLAHQNNWGGGARGLGRPLKQNYERYIFWLVFGAGWVLAEGRKCAFGATKSPLARRRRTNCNRESVAVLSPLPLC